MTHSDKISDERCATFTVESTEVGHLYYFSPSGRSGGPYRKQRQVKAILDIADDGTLAGVELIDSMPPPPALRAAQPEQAQAGRGEQRTICEGCGNANLSHDRATWTDDGSSFCTNCAPAQEGGEVAAWDWQSKGAPLLTREKPPSSMSLTKCEPLVRQSALTAARADTRAAIRANEALNNVIDRCRMDAEAAEAEVKRLLAAITEIAQSDEFASATDLIRIAGAARRSFRSAISGGTSNG